MLGKGVWVICGGGAGLLLGMSNQRSHTQPPRFRGSHICLAPIEGRGKKLQCAASPDMKGEGWRVLERRTRLEEINSGLALILTSNIRNFRRHHRQHLPSSAIFWTCSPLEDKQHIKEDGWLIVTSVSQSLARDCTISQHNYAPEKSTALATEVCLVAQRFEGAGKSSSKRGGVGRVCPLNPTPSSRQEKGPNPPGNTLDPTPVFNHLSLPLPFQPGTDRTTLKQGSSLKVVKSFHSYFWNSGFWCSGQCFPREDVISARMLTEVLALQLV
uniref:Uncharacterized protein n=1 Tax=Timema monikensis TaxID=170555 RepID=A0A7R9E6L5_9NEOP|nr:unnamed protein product [Timema monikensis]